MHEQQHRQVAKVRLLRPEDVEALARIGAVGDVTQDAHMTRGLGRKFQTFPGISLGGRAHRRGSGGHYLKLAKHNPVPLSAGVRYPGT